MIRILALLSFAVALGAAPMSADTLKGVLLDNVCAAGFEGDYAAAKEHSESCRLATDGKKKGFSIVSEDGEMLRLDSKGNGLLMRALRFAEEDRPLEVEIEGKIKGSRVAVNQIRLS